MGLRDLLNPAKIQATPSAGLPQPINLMRPAQDEQQKIASDPGLVDRFVKMLAPYMPKTHTTHPLMNTPYMPMSMLALGGGAYGGYKGLDWLLKKEKDQRSQQAVRDAQQNYQAALAPQYKMAMIDTEDSLGIDKLANAYIEGGRKKEAVYALADALGFDAPMNAVYPRALNPFTSNLANTTGYDAWEGFKGTADSAALALALGAGLGSYNWAKGQNKDEILRKALKKRQLQRAKASPAPLLARTENDA